MSLPSLSDSLCTCRKNASRGREWGEPFNVKRPISFAQAAPPSGGRRTAQTSPLQHPWESRRVEIEKLLNIIADLEREVAIRKGGAQ